jgi:hypothetical protein
MMTKEKAVIEYILRWLDSNIDEDNTSDTIAEDSANLKEKIELALEPTTTIKDIEEGNI